MKKIIIAIYGLFFLTPFSVKAAAIDVVNYPLALVEKVQQSDTFKETIDTLEKAKEQKEKIESAKSDVENANVSGLTAMGGDLFNKKKETPPVNKVVADVADDQEAVKDKVLEVNNMEVNSDTGDLTTSTKEMHKAQANMSKGEVFTAYAYAINNRALISEVREKLNDIQEDIYSSEDNMGTYKVIPEISNLVSMELQEIINLESLDINYYSLDHISSLPVGFKDFEVVKEEEEK